MAKKKILRDPITLREKTLKDGRKSLYLDYYIPNCGRNRSHKYEFLRLYLVPEVDAEDKKKNAATLRAAKAVQMKRSLERINGVAGIADNTTRVLFLDYIRAYINARASVLSEGTTTVYHQLEILIKEYNDKLTLKQLTKEQLLNLLTFISKKKTKAGTPIKRNTAHLYFAMLSCVIKRAYADKLINSNPLEQLTAEDKRIVGVEKTDRDYLLASELQMLKPVTVRSKYAKVVQQAFLYACYTGLRVSDLRRLQWKHIKNDGIQEAIDIKQQKTVRKVHIPLSKTALQYLPPRGADEDYIFVLPTQVQINRIIRLWCKAAGIEKNITFHCSRHTFATLLLTAGADLYTTSKLLGHTNITTTQVYADIINAKKAEAVNLLDNL